MGSKKQKTLVEIREWDTGDWLEVLVNGKLFHEGHDLPLHRMVDLLTELGAEVQQTEVPYEDDEDEDDDE